MPAMPMPRRPLACLALSLALLPAAAHAAPDPLEPANRRVHAFNQAVRATVLAPLTELYLAHAPEPLRRGAAKAVANLSEPITAASALAAGEWGIAANAAARFGINSTLGLGGVRDRAAEMGHARRPFGPGDAACRWGVPSGPYLVLPLLGPTTLRDAGAQAATGAVLSQLLGADALLAWSSGDAFIGYAALHPALQRLEAESLDAYATMRSAHLQRRAAACPVDRAAAAEEEAAPAE
jgi:phospholipid-binding lipoprotein MlaA